MASPLVFSGLASGIDSDALIKALTGSAKAPMTKLSAQKTAFNAQSKKLTDIKSKLSTLQTAAKSLNARSDSLSNKATSADDKILKATSSGGAAMGSYKVKVSSLAQAQRTYGAPLSSDSTAGLAGTGTLKIAAGTADPVEIEITSDDTLAKIASKINGSGAAVTAGVVKEGGNYRLQVTAKQTGVANAVTFTEGGSLALGLAGTTPVPPATDAEVEIDGFKFSSATNAISSAVPGVTLNVVTEGTTNVQIERAPDDLKAKLTTFVTAFNDVVKTLNAEFASTGTAKGPDSLGSDSTTRSLQGALRTVLSGTVDNGSSGIKTLAGLGLAVGRDGTLSLNEKTFNGAVSSDYEGIATALSGLTDGTGLMSRISAAIDPFARSDGALSSKIESLASRSRRIDSQVASMQLRLDKYESTLRNQYAALEQTISGLQSQGNSLSTIISTM